MSDSHPHERPRHSWWRRVLWIFLAAVVLTWLGKALLPDMASYGKEQVAVVRVEGPILDSKQTITELQDFSQDPMVKAIVVRIDSPGGGVAPSQEIYNAVKRVKSDYNKTVVASMGTVAASGGYYIAVASDRVLANPGTLTGSIGVIMQMANFEELLKKVGVKNFVIKSGRYKDLGSPFREMKPEDRQILQSVMDDVHQQFIEAVAEGRSLDIADVELLADGRVFTGRQAKDSLLVDELGDLTDAIQLAGKLSGIEGEPRVVEPTRQFSFRDFLESSFLGNASSVILQTSWNPLMYLMVF
ncbi:MAG: signal peptide peptidase SppA [Nitrospirales bacterium]|nr:signal peptide peptidase SppA [Nitrospira sp.]MDR4500413.1 signal peptide peptidase SppA [Nitrospirales bacterium]